MPDESAAGGGAGTGPGSGANLPARVPLDRAALERVLARAAQLQTHERDPSDAMLTEEQVLEIGHDVGLSAEHVRQALAEERMRVSIAPEEGPMARVFGAAIARASRTIVGEQRRVLQALDHWMQQEECLAVKRSYGERIVWEERQGFMSQMRRGLNFGGRGYHLAKAREVAATVLPVDETRVIVRLEADLANVRGERIAGGATMVVLAAGTTATLLALGVLPVLAVAPALGGLGGSWFVARSHSSAVERAQLALEQALDRLERGDTPPRESLLTSIANSVRVIRF